MKARSGVVLNTALRVRQFMDENATVLDPNIMSARRNRDDAVDQRTALAVRQTGGVVASRGGAAFQQALRANLWNGHLKAIARVPTIPLPDMPEMQQLAVPTRYRPGPA